MTQHSEERLPETERASSSARAGARILPFERPQSDLQRAIQQRAQDALDRDRELDAEKRRPQPLKWLTIFALACIPVLLTIGAVDGFLRVFHKVAAMYSAESSAPAQEQQVAPSEDVQSQPGVVMLQSYDKPSEAQRTAPAPSSNAPAAANAPTQR